MKTGRDCPYVLVWSFSTQNLSHQVTVAFTPDFRGNPDKAVDAFLDEAVCD